MKDFYKILGVEKTASEEVIKQAYRRLAKEHHPDRNSDKEAAEIKFKEVNEAYETLGNKEKRKEYDLMNSPGRKNSFGGFGGNTGYSYSYNGNRSAFEDVFADIFGNGRPDIEELLRARAKQFHNTDYTVNLNVTLEDIFYGTEKEIALKTPDGTGKRLKVSIPKGIKTRQKIIIKGEGGKQNTNLPSGDLIVTVIETKHHLYERDGDNLKVTVEVSPLELILGTSIIIKTLDGSDINLKIPEGANPNKALKIPEKGMFTYGGNSRGDILVNLRVKPLKLNTEEDKITLQEIAKKYA